MSNVLVRFDLQKSRDSFGSINEPSSYTCCGDQGADGENGEEAYSCEDGSGCTPDGDPCLDGSECSPSSTGGGSSAGQNGVATISYDNIAEGVDQLMMPLMYYMKM